MLIRSHGDKMSTQLHDKLIRKSLNENTQTSEYVKIILVVLEKVVPNYIDLKSYQNSQLHANHVLNFKSLVVILTIYKTNCIAKYLLNDDLTETASSPNQIPTS